ADVLVDVVGGQEPRVLLLGLFVMTAVLGQLISNMATALIMIPVALSAAGGGHVSPRARVVSPHVPRAAARADVAHRRRGRVLPDAGRDAGESHGHAPGRLPLRRLLEARVADPDPLRRRQHPARNRDLVVLSMTSLDDAAAPELEPAIVSTGNLPTPAQVEALVAEAHARYREDTTGATSQVYPAL